MQIKEQELFEYIKCPLRYQIIKNGNTLNDTKTFKGMCYEAINSYINAKHNGMKADANTLKRKWDSIAEAGVNSGILNPKKTLDGWGLIYRTYEYLNLYNIQFLDVNTSYSIEFSGTGVCLTGVLNPLIDKGTHIEVFVPCFDKQIPDRLDIDSKLKHTIDAYAIKTMFGKEAIFNYYIPAQGRTIQTLRSTKDFQRLESIVKAVGDAIKANIIYPRETFMCSSCITRHICKAWTGQEEVE